MNEIYHIEYVEKEEETASKVLWAGIQNHMKEQVGDPEPRQLCLFFIQQIKKSLVVWLEINTGIGSTLT